MTRSDVRRLLVGNFSFFKFLIDRLMLERLNNAIVPLSESDPLSHGY